MMTLFTCPKPFTREPGATIQWNSIKSWTLLSPRPEIVLLGNEPGTAELCGELGLIDGGDVARTPTGIPLVNDIFRRSEALASNPLLCYINSDIVLMQDFVGAVERLVGCVRPWVMVGARTDVDLRDRIAFNDRTWARDLRAFASINGSLMDISSDYFVFRKGMYGDMPPFVIGRNAYDNWMLWRARREGVALVDATSDVLAIHHRHEAVARPGAENPEFGANRRLAGRWACSYLLGDASHRLVDGVMVSAFGRSAHNRLAVAWREYGRHRATGAIAALRKALPPQDMAGR